MQNKFAKFIFWIGIVLFLISIILLSIVLYDRFFSLKFPLLINLFTNPTLYFILLFVLLMIYFVTTKGIHTFLKTVIVVVTLISILPLSIMLMLSGGKKVSATNDINNYGVYDNVVRKDLEIFPSEITEDMTPIQYSYYYDWSWDYVYEIYLEVQMTDHSYEELKAKYSDSLSDFRFAEGYEEFVIEDKLNPEIRNNSYYTSYPNIIKIIFNDAENIVIFEYMYGCDPFDLKNSAYINRFNIDPSTYDSNASNV